MKYQYLVFFIIIISCSAWKQKDFKKELEKSSEQEIKVEVSDDLKEKFEISDYVNNAQDNQKEIAPVFPTTKKTNSQVTLKNKIEIQKQNPKKVDNAQIVKQPILPKEPVLPKDYPADFKALNQHAETTWKSFKPNLNQNRKSYLDIRYLGMTVGKIMFTNLGKKIINNKEVWHFHARFKSAPFYSRIYELDDTVDTYVTTDEFLSIRYSVVQRESKMDVDDLQLHDRDKLKTFWFFKQKNSDGSVKNKNKESYIPYFSIDPFSVLFFFQGLPLKDGDRFDIPLINKGKVSVLKSVVEGRERIETANGAKQAIRVHSTSKYKGEHLKSGDMYLWFSDDEQRLLLKVKAKIKIGTITADFVEG